MRNLHYAAYVALVALPFAAACGEDPVKKTAAVIELSKSASDFAEVCDDSSNNDSFIVSNSGTGTLNAVLEVVGDGAAMFDVNPKSLSLSGTGASQEVVVTYHPADELAGGVSQLGKAHNAVLNITYSAKGGQTTEVYTLSGAVANVAVEPVIAFECGDGVPSCNEEAGKTGPCCNDYEAEGGRTLISTTSFHNVLFGGKSQLPVKVKNLGCGSLDVSQIDMNLAFNDCAAGEIRVASPVPFSVQRGQSQDVMLEFQPSNDRQAECQFSGSAVLATNDAVHAPASIPVGGAAVKPKLVITPTYVAFGDVAPGQLVNRTVEFKNTGTFPIQLSGPSWSRNPEEEFGIAKIVTRTCDAAGNELSATDVTLPYTLQPSNVAACGPDEITVTFAYQPNDGGHDDVYASFDYDEGGTTGVAQVELVGGSKPHLVANPENVVFRDAKLLGCTDRTACGDLSTCPGTCRNDGDCAAPSTCFGASDSTPGFCTANNDSTGYACAMTCGSSTRNVEICNSDYGPLVIDANGVKITDSSGGAAPTDAVTGHKIFDIGTDGCSGQTLQKDQCCNVGVVFTDATYGSTNTTAYLKIQSNDESAPFVMLRSNTTIDTAPTADFVPPTSPKVRNWVIIDATPSHDDEGPITSYKWELRDAPGVTAFEPNGDVGAGVSYVIPTDGSDPNTPALCTQTWNQSGGRCYQVLQSGKKLLFYPDIPGEYKFRLTVTDTGCNPSHETQLPVTISVAP